MKLNMNKYIGDIDCMRSMQSITENHVTCVTNKMWYFAFMTDYTFLRVTFPPRKRFRHLLGDWKYLFFIPANLAVFS